jgi:hypothetical protein
LFTVVLLWHAVLAWDAWAEGVNFNAEFLYNVSDSDTKIKTTGQDISTDSYRFNQRYNLDFSKNLFPYLVFATGAVYEHNKSSSTTGDLDTDFLEKRLRPFVELRLDNPIYSAGLIYRKNRIDEEVSDLPDKRRDRDEFSATAGMTPSKEFPEWNFTFIRTITDDDPETIDQTRDLYNFDTQYEPVRDLLLDYTYTRIDTENRVSGFDVLEQTHFGKMGYTRNFLSDRLYMFTEYRIRYNSF